MGVESAGSALRKARAEEPGWGRLRLSEPVVVLTCARSGSTLLRFILDAHPELACPPETSIVDLCTRMGVLSMLLDGPPVGDRPGLTRLAETAIRSWVTTMFGSYLVRTGKSRWCDKSLGSAESAGRFLDLFPQAKFICLYRHCADVIDSGLEACPFGLRGYGFDPFAAAHPGNSVAALADYWVTHTRAITGFEQANPEACLRVRYEDLVSDPEGQADRIYGFLGEGSVEGISRLYLPSDREEFGPGDHKIWSRSSITSESVGRGERVPLRLISPPVVAMVNGLLGGLGYPLLDLPDLALAGPQGEDDAGAAAKGPVSPPESPEPPTTPDTLGPAPGELESVAVLDELEELFAARIGGRLAVLSGESGGSGAPAGRFLITAVVPSAGTGPSVGRWWRVDSAAASLTRGASAPVSKPGEWAVAGNARTWQSVLAGDLNIGTAIRHGHLRFSGAVADSRGVPLPLQRDSRMGALSRLLAPLPAG